MKRLIAHWQDRRFEKQSEKTWAAGAPLPIKGQVKEGESDIPRHCSDCLGKCPLEKMRQSAERGKCPVCVPVYNRVQKGIQGYWSMYQINCIRILTYFLEPDYADNHRQPGFRRQVNFGSNVNLEMNNGSIVELQFHILRGKSDTRCS